MLTKIYHTHTNTDGARSKSSLHKYTTPYKTFDDSCPVWATKQLFYFANNTNKLNLIAKKTKIHLSPTTASPIEKLRKTNQEIRHHIIKNKAFHHSINSSLRNYSNRIDTPVLIGELFTSIQKTNYNLPMHIRKIYSKYKKINGPSKYINICNTIEPSASPNQYKNDNGKPPTLKLKQGIFHNQMLKTMLFKNLHLH